VLPSRPIWRRNPYGQVHFLAEREEILRHKWIESEKAGIDVGFEEALTGWMLKHRSEWRKRRHAARQCV
jgi:hypothetical protein